MARLRKCRFCLKINRRSIEISAKTVQGMDLLASINMTYRQVILKKGNPFDVAIPAEIQTRDTMSDAEFDAMMATGLAQAKAGDSIPYEEAFDLIAKGAADNE